MSDASSVESTDFDIQSAIRQHLPYLRRFARALTGSQSSGDAYAAATLEAIIADRDMFNASSPAKVSLFRVFHAVWSSAGQVNETPPTGTTDVEATAQRRLAALAPPSREAFLLGALEDFSPQEVSAIMDLPESEIATLHQSALAEIQKQTAARILIIEDEPIIAMDIESIVQELGHQSVGIADTRDQAVQMAGDHKPLSLIHI